MSFSSGVSLLMFLCWSKYGQNITDMSDKGDS